MTERYVVFCKETGKYAGEKGRWLGLRNGRRFSTRAAAQKVATALTESEGRECVAVSWTFAKQSESLAKKLRK